MRKVLYNVGDRFMEVVEDVAAYVPYMVVTEFLSKWDKP
jgi:hypothetical protein